MPRRPIKTTFEVQLDSGKKVTVIANIFPAEPEIGLPSPYLEDWQTFRSEALTRAEEVEIDSALARRMSQMQFEDEDEV